MAIIHVNRHFIAQNLKDGGNRPVYTVKETPNSRALYAHELIINGPSRMVYSSTPQKCGARAWIEADFTDLQAVGGWATFQEAKDAA